MILVKEFSEGAGGGVLGPTDIGKALGTDALGVLGQFVDFFSAQTVAAFFATSARTDPPNSRAAENMGTGSSLTVSETF